MLTVGQHPQSQRPRRPADQREASPGEAGGSLTARLAAEESASRGDASRSLSRTAGAGQFRRRRRRSAQHDGEGETVRSPTSGADEEPLASPQHDG
jgi:hypothetical protein